ncbi:hypothetical protein BGW38_000673 [Lunasporangiospora selenospora]|uniref:Uncharacterized protein n=1 Tax=Lunasporangiospora selenospora TaxID=979761 RepID=A0A9P6FVB5_9FUNG|nr:hypothetical protein BGW38_000673 [Lunasporangiospora selenospora]
MIRNLLNSLISPENNTRPTVLVVPSFIHAPSLGLDQVFSNKGSNGICPISGSVLVPETVLSPYTLATRSMCLILITFIISYLLYVRKRRYQGINELLAKYPDPTLPLRDISVAREVWGRTFEHDFPFTMEWSFMMSIFKIGSTPSVSKILVSTKQSVTEGPRRGEETALLLQEVHEIYSRRKARTMLVEKRNPVTGEVSEVLRTPSMPLTDLEMEQERVEQAKDEQRADRALERINFIHSHYNIQQNDYLYNLSLFVIEPWRWVDRYEFRKMTDLEKNVCIAFSWLDETPAILLASDSAVWTKTGRGMGIQNIPESFDEFVRWSDDYAQKHMVYAPSNKVIGLATLELIICLLPNFTYPLLRKMVISQLDPSVRAASGFQEPPKWATMFTRSIVVLRKWIIRYLHLPTDVPYVHTALRGVSARRSGRVDHDEEDSPEDIQKPMMKRCPISGSKEGVCIDGELFISRFDKAYPLYPLGYKIEDLGPIRFLGKGLPTCPAMQSA